MAEYDRVWLPGYEASTTFLALLNILFGLSCIFNKGVCTKESEKYYRRSVQLRRITSDAESVTLMEVQTLLLQCHYLQSTSSATRCWQTLSQAISAAYTLGLNCASSHITNPILRESHLRAWLACRNLDRRVLSVCACVKLPLTKPFVTMINTVCRQVPLEGKRSGLACMPVHRQTSG